MDEKQFEEWATRMLNDEKQRKPRGIPWDEDWRTIRLKSELREEKMLTCIMAALFFAVTVGVLLLILSGACQ